MATLPTTAHSDSIKTAHGGTFTSGDELYVSQYADDYINDLNQSAVDFLTVHFTPNYAGNITADYFKFVCNRTNTGQVIVEWAGDRLKLGGAGGGSTIWYSGLINPAAGGLVEVNGVNWKNAHQSAGRLLVWDDVDLDAMALDGGTADIQPSGTYNTVDSLIIAGATVDFSRLATALTINSGRARFNHQSSAATTLTMNGGILEYLNGTGAIGTANLNQGSILDLRKLNRPLTITTANFKPGSKILMPAKPSLLTITTANLGIGGYDARYAG